MLKHHEIVVVYVHPRGISCRQCQRRFAPPFAVQLPPSPPVHALGSVENVTEAAQYPNLHAGQVQADRRAVGFVL